MHLVVFISQHVGGCPSRLDRLILFTLCYKLVNIKRYLASYQIVTLGEEDVCDFSDISTICNPKCNLI